MWQEFKKETGEEVEAWEIHNPGWVVGEGQGERRGGPPFFVLKCLCAHGQTFPVEGHGVGQRSRFGSLWLSGGDWSPAQLPQSCAEGLGTAEVRAASLLSLYGCR